jgi:hypothetical protein
MYYVSEEWVPTTMARGVGKGATQILLKNGTLQQMGATQILLKNGTLTILFEKFNSAI